MSYLAKNYNRKKISFKFGKGSYLFSSDNKKYLDFTMVGIGTSVLGYADPTINQVAKKSKKIMNFRKYAKKISEYNNIVI